VSVFLSVQCVVFVCFLLRSCFFIPVLHLIYCLIDFRLDWLVQSSSVIFYRLTHVLWVWYETRHGTQKYGAQHGHPNPNMRDFFSYYLWFGPVIFSGSGALGWKCRFWPGAVFCQTLSFHCLVFMCSVSGRLDQSGLEQRWTSKTWRSLMTLPPCWLSTHFLVSPHTRWIHGRITDKNI